MTDPTVRTIWSKSQQAELERLITLRQQVFSTEENKIKTFIQANDPAATNEQITALCKLWIANAEKLRDLLEPFDERTRK